MTRTAELLDRERERYAALHPRSRAAHVAAQQSLVGGVPMTWMAKWAGGFPLHGVAAHGNRITDLDGNEYIDFCLGDTGAMAGHSPPATVAAVHHRLGSLGGATTMLPTEDAAWVGAELSRRFGERRWSFTLTATDANRFAIRIARQLTDRPKILVFSYCYHGSVDETFIVATPDGPRARAGNVGPPVDPAVTTRVVEFNDADALARELAYGDVAAVLTEPALTNIGIVLPEPGFHDAVRTLTADAETLLIVDETHTLSAGPGGCTRAWGLDPDIVTLGKAIGGGVPAGAYGLRPNLAARIGADQRADLEDVGGVGGTLAGNPLSTAAMRATLELVLTDDAFERMCTLGDLFAAGVSDVLESTALPWCIVSLGRAPRCASAPSRRRAEARRRPQPTTSSTSSSTCTSRTAGS